LRPSKILNPLAVGLGLGLVLGGWVLTHRLGWRAPGLGTALEVLERKLLDVRFWLRGPEPPGPEVFVLAFDDDALAEEPELFERRDGFRRVFEALAAAGPRVVLVDALFVDPERLLPARLAEDVLAWAAEPEAEACRACRAPALLERVRHELEADERLAESIRALGRVVLAVHVGHAGQGSSGVDPSLAKCRYGQSVPGVNPAPEAAELTASLPAFNAAAAGLGLITLQEDETHAVRGLVMARQHRGATYAPLAVQALALAEGVPRARLAYLGQGPDGRAEVRIGSRRVPLELGDELLLNPRGPTGTFPTRSVLALVRGELEPELLRDRIVVLGFTYFGHDAVRTAFGPGAGVEIHATALDNLRRSDWLRRASPWLDSLLCLLVAGLVGLVFWPRLGLSFRAQLGLSALGLAGLLAGTQACFTGLQRWIGLGGPLLGFALAGASGLALAYLGEGVKRRQIRRTFSHYLSDQVIERLLAHPENLRPGGERRELSVLFSDIRGFTGLAEGLEPEVLTELLNGYLTPMTDIVLRHGGLLDKYIGDALMAVYGAPVPLSDHAAAACRSALDMLVGLEALRPAWRARGLAGPEIGLGINTGPMSVGNMGSAQRFDYTVVGDQVNLASRFEGLNKVYGTRILVGEATRRAAGAGFVFRELDLVAVKGRREPVRVFELLPGGREAWVDAFEAGLAAYRARRWDEAEAAFAALARDRGDGPAGVFLERIARLRADPPGPGWDGSFQVSEK
jgi:adenylate cyclase